MLATIDDTRRLPDVPGEDEFRSMVHPQSIRSERYRIEEKLGAGEIGVVFRGYDAKREEPVALKTLRERSADHTYNLKREFRALQRVQHPNLVRLYDLVVDGDDAFFAMELVEGTDILFGLPGAMPSRLDAIGQRFSQLAVGIHALHLAEKLHRDLKPTNVLIEKSTGRVVIVDFGLAVATKEGETTASVHGQLAGTYAYMPPEQGWGQALTPAADWYAFGVTLFEALVGTLPWPAGAAEAFQRKQQGSAPAKPLFDAGVPQPWIDLVVQLTAPQAEQRPAADEILRFFSVEIGPQAKTSSATKLFGREEASELFADALGADGAAVAVVEVTGRSGIGKTSFLNALLHDEAVRSPSTVMFSGCCYDDVTAPFAALDELMDNLCRWILDLEDEPLAQLLAEDISALTTVFPVLERIPGVARAGTADPLRTRRAATKTLARVLGRVCDLAGATEVCLSLDDLQWGDSESAHFIADVVGFLPDTTPLRLVLSHRKDSPAPFVDILRRRLPKGTPWSQIPLAPLGSDALTQLAHSVLDGMELDDDEYAWRVGRVLSVSGGLPFSAALLARADRRAGAAPSEANAPTWMRLLVTRDLSPLEIEVLSTVALAHIPLPEEALHHALSAADHDAIASALNALSERSLLRRRTRDALWEMFHDRIRQAVVAAFDDDGRKDIERRLAFALDQHADPRVRAQAWTHWKAVGDVEQAARGAYQAGLDAAAKLAFAQAVDCFEYALLAPEATDAALDEILRALGHASALLGRVQEAADQLLMAASYAPVDQAIEDERHAAEILIGAGELDKGKMILAQTFAKIGETLPQNSLSRALAVRGRLRLRGWRGLQPRPRPPTPTALRAVDTLWVAVGALGYVEPLASFIAQNEHLRRTLAFEEPNRLGRALALEMVYVGSRLGSANETALEERLTVLANGGLAADVKAFITLSRGYLAFLRGKFERAKEVLQQALVQYESLGARRWQENLGRIHLVFVELYLGNFDRATALCDEQRYFLESTGDRLNLGMLELGAGFAVALADDDDMLARERIDATWTQFTPLPDNLHYIGSFARAQVGLYAADDDTEARWLAERKRLKAMLVFENVWIVVHWIDGILAMRHATPNVDVALKCAKKIERANCAWGNALAAILRAGVKTVVDGPFAGAAACEIAVDLLRAASMSTHAAAVASWRDDLLGDLDARERHFEMMTRVGIRNPLRWRRMWLPLATSSSAPERSSDRE